MASAKHLEIQDCCRACGPFRTGASSLSSGKCRIKPHCCLLQGWDGGEGKVQGKGCRLLPHTHWDFVPSPLSD